jgi:integrase
MSRPATGQVVERRGKRGRTTYALRFRAYGRRNYLTLDVSTRADADVELANVLADVRRGIWQPPAEPVAEAPREVPTFHRFATDWVDRHKHEVRPRTLEFWTWLLSGHLLRAFAPLPLTAITVELIDRYRTSKLREQGLVERPLSNTSINRSLSLLERILDAAVEYELIDRNPAAGKRRRLRPTTPNRTWLEPHEAQAVLDAAGKYRPLLATLILSGLRIGELTNLRWGQVDLAGAKLRVIGSKTEAGVRVVDLSPMLLDELKAHKAAARYADPTSLVFCTAKGTPLNRNTSARACSEGGRTGERGARRGRRRADRRRHHEPLPAEDVREPAVRSRGLTCLRDEPDGAHELGARPRGVRARWLAAAKQALGWTL